MATVTTDFITASAPRSRAQRLSDGVVAQYIRTLAGDWAEATVSVGVADTPAQMAASDRANDTAIPRRSKCWSRGGRAGSALRAKRIVNSR